MIVLARLRGSTVADIAAWLEISTYTVREHLRHVGGTVARGHWQSGGYFADKARLEALGLTHDEITRTGAIERSDSWYSADMPAEPSKRWLQRRADARRRYLKRRVRQALREQAAA